MATYAFETITPEQALTIGALDTLTFAGGPASRVSVVYQSYDPLILTPEVPSILVTVGDRTVKFAVELTQLARAGRAVMADGSKLYIGDTSDEQVIAGAGHDGLYAGPGNDTVDAGAGDDVVQGNSGNDVLNGGAGSNTVYGGKGDDVINVSAFRESRGSFAHGNQGDDEIVGGEGNDTLYGGQGNDFIGGRDGDDLLFGDLGDDEIHAGGGDDTVFGGAGNDQIYSNGGDDLLLGGDGDDMLVMYMPGNALAHGDAGNDTIISAAADATVLYGGEGRDRFEFVSNARPGEGMADLIADWEADDSLSFAQVSIYTILPRQYSEFTAETYERALQTANEHIMFTGAQYVAAQVGDDVWVFADTNGDSSDGADVELMLVGRTLADISLLNFV